jgi:hypothetical protein
MAAGVGGDASQAALASLRRTHGAGRGAGAETGSRRPAAGGDLGRGGGQHLVHGWVRPGSIRWRYFWQKNR